MRRTESELPSTAPDVEKERKYKPEDRLYTIVVVLVVAIMLLIPAVIYGTIVVLRGIESIDRAETQSNEQIQLQRESAIRECAFAATNGEFFSSTCLEPEILDGYGRDVMRFLDPDDPSQGPIRERICRAFNERGILDTDCV